MQLFYFSNIQINNSTLLLDKEHARHFVKVLRKKVGDIISITDGLGNLYNGIIEETTSNHCRLSLSHVKYVEPSSPELHIAIAPTKMNDRMEWFLEKATELGITSITPIICHNSERRTIKSSRYEKIIKSAMQQSLQLHKPILNPLVAYNDFIKQMDGSKYGNKIIAHCEDRNKTHLRQLMNTENHLVLIGPEGDFSKKEIDNAIKLGFQPAHLGETRLRTETAGIYAAALFNAQLIKV